MAFFPHSLPANIIVRPNAASFSTRESEQYVDSEERRREGLCEEPKANVGLGLANTAVVQFVWHLRLGWALQQAPLCGRPRRHHFWLSA